MMDLFLSVYGEVLATCALLVAAGIFKKSQTIRPAYILVRGDTT